MSRILT